jgi:hypothetical protein
LSPNPPFHETHHTTLALRRWALPTASVPSLLLGALLTLLLLTSSASAEEVFTSQAAAANATASTWIPAPAQRAALCIVDTGTTPNPDTTNVIARFSVDGGDPSDLSPDHHGTLMSMIASAPYNHWGMVGAAPSINIVSIRASRDGRTFGGNDLTAAVQICINKRLTYNIKAVSLSLGGIAVNDLDEAAMEAAEDTVENARRAGLNVIAAAGNHAGPADWPAAYPPVLAVGAASDTGGRCPFATAGDEVDLSAPGCPVDVASWDGSAAWASGSSEAAAFVAGVLTQLRAFRPDLGTDQAETALRPGNSARLDVAAAFRRVGLAVDLDGAMNSMPQNPSASGIHPDSAPDLGVSSAPPPALSATPPATEDRPPRIAPRLPRTRLKRLRLRNGALVVTPASRDRGVQLVVSLTTRRRLSPFPMTRAYVRKATDVFRIRVSGTLKSLTITSHDPTGARSDSLPLVLHPKPS